MKLQTPVLNFFFVSPVLNDENRKKVEEEGKELGGEVEGSKQAGSKVEGSKQVEEDEPFELLSDLDLLYSHYLDLSLPIVLETLLCSPDMTTELWKW